MSITDTAATLSTHVDALRDLPANEISGAISKAAAQLASPSSEIGRRAREELPAAAGLHPAMVDWALRTTFEKFDQDSLDALYAEGVRQLKTPTYPEILGVVLSGNVFTASARAVLVPLLFGVPVFAKASSTENLFPTLLKSALESESELIGEAFGVATFSRDDTEVDSAFLKSVSALSVYGSDATIETIRAKLEPSQAIFEHGHGLGVAYLSASSVLASSISRLARNFAIDVAAYDQRGCLSPQAIYIEEDEHLKADDFAKALSEELAALSVPLPRGNMPADVGAAQVQWRGIALTEGLLFQGDDFSVACPDQPNFRRSPGYRNVQVLRCKSPSAFVSSIEGFGNHLKRLGCGAAEDRASLEALFPPALRPSICELGEMQTPKLSDIADGVPAWDWLRPR